MASIISVPWCITGTTEFKDSLLNNFPDNTRSTLFIYELHNCQQQQKQQIALSVCIHVYGSLDLVHLCKQA
jgi:hypothetical protein